MSHYDYWALAILVLTSILGFGWRLSSQISQTEQKVDDIRDNHLPHIYAQLKLIIEKLMR